MSLYEFFTAYAFDGSVILIVILTILQIAPIKINPWSKIASAIGKALNKNLEEEVLSLKTGLEETNKKVDNLTEKFYENSAIQSRSRILRFGDEVSHGTNHSRDHFQQILRDITDYDLYCADHPNFKNNVTQITSERIREDYKNRDMTNSFL